MRAYGKVAVGTVGERGLDLPTEPIRRDRPTRSRAVQSPIPPVPREDTDAVARARQAERAAAAEKAQTDRAAAAALRLAGRTEERRQAREAAERARQDRAQAAAAERAARAERAEQRPARTAKATPTAEPRQPDPSIAALKATLTAEVRRRYDAGEHLADIAAAMRISVTQVIRLRQASGAQLRRKPLDRDECVRLYEAGLSMQQVADALGASMQGIRYQLGKAGVETRPQGRNGHDPATVQAAVARYAAGESPIVISRDLKVSQNSIARWCLAAGVPRRAPGKRGPAVSRG